MDTQKIAAAIEMARSAACNLGVIEKWHPSVTDDPIFILLRAQLYSAIDSLEGGDGELGLPPNAALTGAEGVRVEGIVIRGDQR